MDDLKGELSRLEWIKSEIARHEKWLVYFRKLLEDEKEIEEIWE